MLNEKAQLFTVIWLKFLFLFPFYNVNFVRNTSSYPFLLYRSLTDGEVCDFCTAVLQVLATATKTVAYIEILRAAET